MLAAFRMFGHLALIHVPDLDRTDYFLILGTNKADGPWCSSRVSAVYCDEMKAQLSK